LKKVGIVTICDYKNYGNRLQNYASQETIKSLGFDVRTITNIPIQREKLANRKIIKYKSASIKEIYDSIKRKLILKFNKKSWTELQNQKINNFKEFTKKYISETEYIISVNNIPLEKLEEFDYFVAGSDQVWNPNYRLGSSIDFLTFAPGNKRIAYSPSFGVSEIPEKYKSNYKKWLSEFNHLSVREQAGADIIEELTNRKSPVLVDPTIMLSKEDWLAISRKSPFRPEKNYLLTYFLGERSKKLNKKIKEIAKKNGLVIVNLGDLTDVNRYVADPSEFIDYINKSSLFITDSFHGAVFSIILEKPFVVKSRIEKIQSMNSRIDTLLSKFNLNNRKWENIMEKSEGDLFKVDYSQMPIILKREREKVIEYLQKALKN